MADRADSGSKPGGFEEQARARKSAGIVGEFWYLISRTRKWWMAPLVLALLMVGVLLVMGGTAAGPFIYALF